MLNFIKGNVKFVVTVGVSFLIIAGLTTALILTNVGPRGAGRNRASAARIELTEEQVAQRAEEARARLQQRVTDGSITQEEYESRLAAIESGEFRGSRGSRSEGSRSERNASGEQRTPRSEREPLTEEQIAERLEKSKAKLEQKLAAGEITQAEYDEKHIVGAILIPVDEIKDRAEGELPDKNALVMVYCRTGVRSKNASEILVELGYVNIQDIGGISTWSYETE